MAHSSSSEAPATPSRAGLSRIEIITIGDELVEGRLTDTNSGWMSRLLFEAGFEVAQHTSVGDRHADMKRALIDAASRAEAVLISGGLGPTTDDFTAEVAAEAFGREVVLFPQALDHVRQAFRRMGREMTPNNEKQALLPAGCTLIHNSRGTATGFWLDQGGCRLYFMPGVPREMMGMMEQTIVPDIQERLTGRTLRIASFKIMGLGESKVGALLEDLRAEPPGELLIQYRAASPEVHVRLCLAGYETWESAGDEALESLASEAAHRLGANVYTRGNETLPERLLNLLLHSGESVATAESCTAGMMAAELTSVAGISTVYPGGVVVYANSAKAELLGVPREVLNTHGAVSEPVAAAMARSVREKLETTYGIAITGIAGPGGGTPEKPVGTVYLALATPDKVEVRKLFLPGDRERIRRYSAFFGLDMLRRQLEGVLGQG